MPRARIAAIAQAGRKVGVNLMAMRQTNTGIGDLSTQSRRFPWEFPESFGMLDMRVIDNLLEADAVERGQIKGV